LFGQSDAEVLVIAVERKAQVSLLRANVKMTIRPQPVGLPPKESLSGFDACRSANIDRSSAGFRQEVLETKEDRGRWLGGQSTRPIRSVVRQIPRLSWTRIANLFRSAERFSGSTHPEQFGFVPDPADRKFAALAAAATASLVTSDGGLLNVGERMAVPVLKPSEFVRRLQAPYEESELR
jgi:hypothetical protein